MNEALIGALASALVMIVTALLGKETLGKWLMSGQSREVTAQAAIIEREAASQAAIIDLAKAAICGWREEGTAVARLVELLREHDKGAGYYYEDLRKRSEDQSHRLEVIGDQMSSLITILADREKRRNADGA